MKQIMGELKVLLSNVSDAYYDFIYGMLKYVDGDASRCAILSDYIRNHPEAESSDIIKFATFNMDLIDEQQTINPIMNMAAAQ